MLLHRILSAAAAIAVIVPTLLWGGVEGVGILVTVLGGIASWELIKHMPALTPTPVKLIALTCSVFCSLAIWVIPAMFVQAFVVWVPLLIILLHLFLYNSVRFTVDALSQTLFVIFYVSIPLAHAILLSRLLFLGTEWIFFVLFVICLGDAGAYFAGKRYGKRHISPHVSPNKTLEGLVGGLLGNFVGMFLMKILVPDLPPVKYLIFITLVLSVAGPLGDLTASAIKRRLEIKDFGSIMPGHGGILDRADSLIPAFPALYYFLIMVSLATPL
jgi:phosphatidate cytidylyltransferase